MQEALGTVNNSSFAQAAVDYAYAHGVIVVASAADEESDHHNYPANYNHTLEVNSVTRWNNFNGLDQTPHSYLYLNGCTNYGAHIAVSVESSSCSSEATGKSSGIAGLVYSAALNEIDAGRLSPYPSDSGALMPLSANEVKQLLTMTADDINFDARPDLNPPLPQNYMTSSLLPGVIMSERYHSIAGFDQYFGYGRINANTRRAARAGGHDSARSRHLDPRLVPGRQSRTPARSPSMGGWPPCAPPRTPTRVDVAPGVAAGGRRLRRRRT